MATTPTSIGPIGARQINRSLYVGQSDLTTIQSAVNFAVAQGGSFVIVIPHGYSNADNIAAVSNGSGSVILSDLRGHNAQNYEWVAPSYIPANFTQTGNVFVATLGVSAVATIVGELHAYGGIETEEILVGQTPAVTGAKVLLIGTNPSMNQIQLSGETIGGAYDQDILINPSGANVLIGSGVSIDNPGTITAANGHVTGDLIVDDEVSAASADFAACLVASSPVRTFANTPDGPGQGMVWPTPGVPVSLGDHWQAASINPATLATWPAAGIPVSTGAAWGTSLAPGSLATYPPAGIAVSTGTAWGTPIAAANMALLNAANTFSAVNTFSVSPMFGNGVGAIFGFPTSFSGNGLYFGWNHGTPQGMSEFLNQRGTGTSGFRWWDVTSAGVTTLMGTLTAAGLTIPAAITATTSMICANGKITLFDRAAGSGTVTTPNINSDNQALLINAGSGAGTIVYLNWDHGTGGTIFGNGAGVNVGSVDGTGHAIFASIAASGAKTFAIKHPLDETKNLVHACLEGPENGVYYRGESTTSGGWAEITLPDYFEALTMQEYRSVLLTALFEDEDDPISALAASRVKDGKFKVWSGVPAQKFYWEVKAVRGDIEPLIVEPLTPEPLGMRKGE